MVIYGVWNDTVITLFDIVYISLILSIFEYDIRC